jgi:hypothetical protein
MLQRLEQAFKMHGVALETVKCPPSMASLKRATRLLVRSPKMF